MPILVCITWARSIVYNTSSFLEHCSSTKTDLVTLMATRVSYSGHETFPLRFNWLKKAVDLADEDKHIFNADRAIAAFGVGKNMVRAIRHWGLACGVLQDDDASGAYDTTEFGKQLLSGGGWDPYLEDTGTLWLLHWKLCATPEPSPLWHFAFADWRGREINISSLKPAFSSWAEQHDISLPATSTLKRDLACLLNTYTKKPSRRRGKLEEGLESPFTGLNLVHLTDGAYHFRRGPQPSLPAEIFAYAVLDFWQDRRGDVKSISMQEIIQEAGSPGRIFKLAENRAFDLLLEIESWQSKPFTYVDSAGTRQLFRQDEEVTTETILEQYYARADQLVAI